MSSLYLLVQGFNLIKQNLYYFEILLKTYEIYAVKYNRLFLFFQRDNPAL